MKVGIAIPYALSRSGLRALLVAQEDTQVAIEVDSVLDNVEAILSARPDVLIVSALEQPFDLTTLSRMHKLLPETSILLLTDKPDEEFEFQVIRTGAWGCVSRRCTPGVLEKALTSIAHGEIWVSGPVATRLIGKLARRQLMNGENPNGLTRREWEILGLVANGHHNKEIANSLSVSENTVKTHLHSIFGKIHVDSRLGATLHYYHHATRSGLTENAPPAPSAEIKERSTLGNPARKIPSRPRGES
jgi:DNA-binding NarL/FixJ family response regulator